MSAPPPSAPPPPPPPPGLPPTLSATGSDVAQPPSAAPTVVDDDAAGAQTFGAPPPWDFSALDDAIAAEAAAAASSTSASSTAAGPELPWIVLLTTGAMNPVHRGHVQLLHAAAAQVRQQGRGAVLGAFLSPSHDRYLRAKMTSMGGSYYPAPVRLAAAQAALRSDALVKLGAWECQREGYWPDFPEVCAALEAALRARYPANAARLRVMYCCGADHYNKCGLRRGISETVGVCVVEREGSQISTAGMDPSRVVRVAAPSAELSTFSSTAVREAMASLNAMLPPGVMDVLLSAQLLQPKR